MKPVCNRFGLAMAVMALAIAAPFYASADEDYDALKAQVEALQQQLAVVQETLKNYALKTATKVEVQEVRQKVAQVTEVHSEWKNTDSVVHLAGYGDATYSDNQNSPGAFSGARFNPIFHYQYKNLVMLESELEIEVGEDGDTETALEYLTVDVFLNDYIALIAGKFLSPIGQFRQNFHPSWINKLPTTPSGFGHDQAAPVSEMGLQARGGYPVGNLHMNYSFFVGNGPVLEIEDGQIGAVEAEGRTSNDDKDFVFGGRLGLTPLASSEIGVSFATGKAAGEDEQSASRNYDTYGADLGYKWRSLGFRAEYVTQKVGSNSASEAPNSARWEAWYVQAVYRFLPTKFEGVVRYSDYDANLREQSQTQWALGVNYLFSPNAMAKLAYNFNDGQSGSRANDDGFQIQIAYGF